MIRSFIGVGVGVRESMGRACRTHEYPRPAWFPSYTTHLCDSCCKQATEGTGEGSSGEEDCGADAEF